MFLVPSLRRAGAEKQLIDLVNGLPNDRFDKYLVSYGSDNALVDELDTEYVTVHLERKNRKFDRGLASRIGQLMREHDPDIVHCTLQNALLYAWLGRLLSGARQARLVGVIHTTLNVDMKHELADRLLYQLLLRQCSQVWFVCRAQQRHWQSKFGFLDTRSRVIYNGVDSTRFTPSADAVKETVPALQRLPSDAVIISSIAGFRPEKGHDILVRAFENVSKAEPRARLVLVGDGPTRSAVEQLVSDLGLREKVVFPGLVDDVRPILRHSRCTVLASTAVETFSIAMLESMSMAVPVVATDIGGACEAIDDGRNGYLVSPGDANGLEKTLTRIATDAAHARLLGSRARDAICERFDIASMVDDASAALEKLVAVPPSGAGAS